MVHEDRPENAIVDGLVAIAHALERLVALQEQHDAAQQKLVAFASAEFRYRSEEQRRAIRRAEMCMNASTEGADADAPSAA